MKLIWFGVSGIAIAVAGYFLFLADDFQVPPPAAQVDGDFSVPLPTTASIVTIPIHADLTKIFSEAKQSIANPVAQGSEVVNVPTSVHLQLYATRIVQKEITKFEDKVEQETRRECDRSERRCARTERRVEKICRDVPWPLNEICDLTEKTICAAHETTCVAWKTVVVGTKVVKVPVKVLVDVEEEFVDIIDKVADIDAELDYTVNLVDLDANFDEQLLQGFVEVEYKIKLNARLNGLDGKIKLAEVNGVTSCGYDEPMRRLRMNFTAEVKTLEEAALSIEEPTWSLEWPNACQLTAFDVQLEDLIDLPVVKNAVKKAIDKAIDKAIRKANGKLRFQDTLDQVWPEISAPISIGNEGWIAINPNKLSIAPISGQGKEVHAVVSVKAHPVISDVKPKLSEATEAPKVQLSANEPGVFVNLGAGMSYASIETQINDALTNLAPDFVSISEVEVYASLETSGLVVGVRIEEPVKGKIYLISGVLLGDTGTRIDFTDLDFSIESKNALLKAADIAFHDKLRDLLREAIVLDFSDERDEALLKYGELQIPIDENGSNLSLMLENANLVGLQIMPKGVYAVLQLEGQAQANIAP